ncbi:MAG: secretin N-terminal domain-containing protein [bacterium]
MRLSFHRKNTSYEKMMMNKIICLAIVLFFPYYALCEETKKLPLPPESLPQEVQEKLRQETILGQEIPQPPQPTTDREIERTPPEIQTPTKRTMSNKITINVKNMEIIDVLNILAKKGGMNIVASKNVQGRVTIFLEEISVEDALKVICEVNDLAYEKKDELIKVMANHEYEQLCGKKANDRKILTMLEIKYAQPTSILQLLNGVKSREGKIFIDERTNKLIIIDLPELIQQMQEIIKALDTPSITKTFTLTYAQPQKLEPALKSLLSRDGKLQTDSLNKKIIVTDISEKVEVISQLIREFDNYPELSTEIFTLNYAKPEEIVEKIKDELTKEIGTVKMDKRTNKVIVSDLPSQIKRIKEIVTTCDTQTKEVVIEAKIIQVNLSDEFKFGIDWEYLAQQTDNLNIKTNLGALTQGEAGIRIEAGVLNTDDYHILLEALKTIGDTKLLSTPKVAVISGEEAKILVGSNVPYITEETVVPQQGNPIKVQKVTYIDVGVKLFVTPKISEDDFVTIKIKPEVSAVTRYVDNNIPVVETSNVESEIRIKDGMTIVIGGLVKEEKTKEIAQVPFLRNIPFLGYLFKKETTKKLNSELVILLTPKIITGEGS